MCLLLDSSIYLHGSGHALEAHFITALPLALSAVPFQHHFIESSLILPGTHSLPIHCPERPAKKCKSDDFLPKFENFQWLPTTAVLKL